MDHLPIGIFDSGLGGLSVWREVRKALPDTPIIYAADSARCPYGERPADEIRQFGHEMTQWLMNQGARLIVVACNTATAAAIEALRETYPLPFVGMEPAVKPAATHTQTGTIGILATKGTFQGDHFQRTSQKYGQGLQILVQEGKGLVEFVEDGQFEGEEVERTLRQFLTPMTQEGADQIVLGCSHYPFLREQMQAIVGNAAHIIDPAPAVARQVVRLYQQLSPLTESIQHNPPFRFFTSGEVVRLRQMVNQITQSHLPSGTSFEKRDFAAGEIYAPSPADHV